VLLFGFEIAGQTDQPGAIGVRLATVSGRKHHRLKAKMIGITPPALSFNGQ